MVAYPLKTGAGIGIMVALMMLLMGNIGIARELERDEKVDAIKTFALALPENTYSTYFPSISVAREGLYVNPQNRDWSIGFYHTYYQPSLMVPTEWTGNHQHCNPGTLSSAFQTETLRRINYFRAMAGVPAGITFNEDYSAKAQHAALMMSVNRRLSHSPDPNWICFTPGGSEGAGNSNLFLEVYGADAITGYMADGGGANFPVGHRRWLLYPQTQTMGSGDIPPQNGYPAANALWVIDDHIDDPRPDTREPFVAWPPPGYIPYQVLFPRWSFSYSDADFSGASVSMSLYGQPVALTVQPSVPGFGENTLTWEPILPVGMPPHGDIPYQVTIRNVGIDGSYQDFSYNVIVVNPDL